MITDQSLISHQPVAARSAIVLHLVGDWLAADRRSVGDSLATSRKPLQVVGDHNQSRLVFMHAQKTVGG